MARIQPLVHPAQQSRRVNPCSPETHLVHLPFQVEPRSAAPCPSQIYLPVRSIRYERRPTRHRPHQHPILVCAQHSPTVHQRQVHPLPSCVGYPNRIHRPIRVPYPDPVLPVVDRPRDPKQPRVVHPGNQLPGGWRAARRGSRRVHPYFHRQVVHPVAATQHQVSPPQTDIIA